MQPTIDHDATRYPEIQLPAIDYAFSRIGIHDWRAALRRDDGAISTETAVVTFLLVVIAGAVGVILWNAAQSQANAIPVDTSDPTGG